MTSINPIDYFNTTQLPEQYDFNKDGKIDISDYNYAVTTLQDTDPDNDVAFKKDELDKVFATIIQDAMDENDQSIDEQNAKEQADTIIAVMKNGTLSPDNATSLTNLQLIGKNLTKYIKQSADIAKVLAKLIEEKEAELEKTQEDAQHAQAQQHWGVCFQRLCETEELYAWEECEERGKGRLPELQVAQDYHGDIQEAHHKEGREEHVPEFEHHHGQAQGAGWQEGCRQEGHPEVRWQKRPGVQIETGTAPNERSKKLPAATSEAGSCRFHAFGP